MREAMSSYTVQHKQMNIAERMLDTTSKCFSSDSRSDRKVKIFKKKKKSVLQCFAG